ncbi:hypothetical protein [Nocardia mangyaensis]|uniref:hypothetical protein n=1 Tax=Nocardia mangyaensis TaxID=2213200 RepID=UPI001F0ABBED|nr:hypothetical protein [Nocardia mangyaensis]
MKSTVRKSSLRRAGIATMAATAALIGFSGPAAALPTDPTVQFTPTISRTPGANCAAILNAWTVPQPKSGEFGVKVKITQTGDFCQTYRVAVNWRNLDTGRTNGQSHRVVNGELEHAPDGVITGMGMGPGAGRVEAWIVTTDETLPEHQELEHISGRASFTLG